MTTAAETPASTYFHSQDDAYKIKEYMRAIIVDVGVDHLPEISKVFSKGELDPIVDEKLAAKTTALLLPLIFKSENKYDELKVVIDSDLVCPHIKFPLKSSASSRPPSLHL